MRYQAPVAFQIPSAVGQWQVAKRMSFLFQENFTTGSLALDLCESSQAHTTLQPQLQPGLSLPQQDPRAAPASRKQARRLSVPRKPVGTGVPASAEQEAHKNESCRPKPRRKPVAEPLPRHSVTRVPIPIYHSEHEIDEAYKEYVVSPSHSDHDTQELHVRQKLNSQ